VTRNTLVPLVIDVQVGRLVYADGMEAMAAGIEVRPETVPDVSGDVFRGCDHTIEGRHLVIEKTVIVDVDDFAIEDLFQQFEVEHHAGDGIGLAAEADLDHVVVSMAVRIGGGAEQAEVLFGGKGRVPADVGGGEFDFSGDDHGTSFDARCPRGDTI
jgi:hypothetical protein